MTYKPKTKCPKCNSSIHRTPDGFACDKCLWEIYDGSFKEKKDA